MSEHLEAVMEEHGEYCLRVRVAYLYVKDWTIAEEIVQDVFFAYYRQPDRFEQRYSLKNVFYRRQMPEPAILRIQAFLSSVSVCSIN
ncbi:sigma factor [Lysinibacillus fusiformis]|uniref:sigma factor n=1 Tax=Lysinibacillus fusiformis TaxID=28031 RepID=UPI003453F07B